MLMKGTMRISTKRFPEDKSFFVSVIVMPDDSKCFSNLTKNNSMTSSEVVTTRRKKISVGLEEVPEISFQSLFVPLAGPLFFIFGTVFVSAFIFCSRFCTRKGYDVTMQQSQGQAQPQESSSRSGECVLQGHHVRYLPVPLLCEVPTCAFEVHHVGMVDVQHWGKYTIWGPYMSF